MNNKTKPNQTNKIQKKPSILKLRNTKNGPGWRSKGQKTINKNEFQKKRKKKRKKVVFRKAEAEANSRRMGAWASHGNLSQKELQVVASTKKKTIADYLNGDRKPQNERLWATQ